MAQPVYDDQKSKPKGAEPDADIRKRADLAHQVNKAKTGEELRKITGISPEEEQDMEDRASQPEDLRNAEEQANGQPSASPAQTEEQTDLNDRTGGRAIERFRRFGEILASPHNRKPVVAAGGIGTGVVALILLFSGFATSELVGWRENMLGKGNEVANTVLSTRRQRSYARVMNKLRRGAMTNAHNTMNDAKFDKNWEPRGYKTVRGADGKLTEFSKLDEDGSVARSFDLDEPNSKKALLDFMEGDLGDTIRTDFKEVMVERAATWKGRAARSLWRKMRVRFVSWVDREPSDKADTDEEKLAENLRAEEAEESGDPATRNRASTDDDARDVDGDGEPDPGSELSDPSTDLGEEAAEYREKLLDDPGVGDEIIEGAVDSKTLEDMADRAPAAFGAVLQEGSDEAVQSALGDLARRIPGKLAGAAVKGIIVTDWYNATCQAKGTLLFTANMRNLVLSASLAAFTVKFLTIADHEKAGAVTSEGIKLAMIYLHTPSPKTGRSYYQAAGTQNRIGNYDAKVSEVSRGKYSTGRANTGVLAQVGGFLDANPLARYGVHPTACKITNNGLVQVAGAGVGIVIAIFGGSETGITQAQIATSIGMALAKELVLQVSKPMLLKLGSGILFNGLERNGEDVGDGLASGMGALAMMNGGANALKPVTWDQANSIRAEARQIRKKELAKMNPFERYLSMENPDSLTSQAYFAAPKNFAELFGKLPSLIQPEKLANNLVSSVMPKKVAWAQSEANSQCEDTWIRDNHLATDAFCNVEMGNDSGALDVTESENLLLGNNQITIEGNAVPGSEYEKFVKKCHSGAASVIYKTEVSDTGTEDATDNTCLTPGEPLPSDTYGRYERFTNFYGYFVDEANISEENNDKYIDVSEATATGAQVGAPPVTGGPCPNAPVGREATVHPAGSLSNVLVHTCVVQQVNSMIAAAAAQGVTLTAGNSWRDPQQQIALREANCGSGHYNVYLKPAGSCSPPTAIPGTSRHERGLAIDFSNCDDHGTKCWQWLNLHAATYGYKNLPSEAWHWSADGH